MADTYTYHQYNPPGIAFVVRDTDGVSVSIPLDLANMDYQAFLAWMAEGNPAPEGWVGPTNQSG